LLKAKAKAQDLTLKAKAKAKGLTFKVKAKAKDSKFVLEDTSKPRRRTTILELTAIWELGSGRKRNRQRDGKVTERLEFGEDAANVEEEAIFVQSYKSRARDLDLATPWMGAHLETIVLVAIEPFVS